MKKGFLVMVFFALTLILLYSANAGEWIETDTYVAPTASINIDGNASDWAGIEQLTGIEFKTAAGDWVVFEEYNGGIWNGPDDHTTSVAFAWEPDAFYVYTFVVDDEHQNSNSWYDGDAVQLVFANADQTAVTYLYNYALTDAQDAILIGNETAAAGGLTDADIAIVRDDTAKTTFYEARFIPEILGLTDFAVDMRIAIGVCVNDGDKDTPGQKGWSGWGPHAAVFGKDAPKTGLVILSTQVITAVKPFSKLTTTWGEVKR